MCTLACFILSHISLILFLVFFFFGFVCCPDRIMEIIQSSRSLIHSSVMFILLFIAISSAFISVNEFL